MIANSEFDRVARRAERRDWSKNAFNCAKCPGADCPAWWKTTWERTGPDGHESVPLDGCSFVLHQLYAQGAVAGAVINRAAVSEAANRITQVQKAAAVGLARRLQVVQEDVRALPAAEQLPLLIEAQILEGGS